MMHGPINIRRNNFFLLFISYSSLLSFPISHSFPVSLKNERNRISLLEMAQFRTHSCHVRSYLKTTCTCPHVSDIGYIVFINNICVIESVPSSSPTSVLLLYCTTSWPIQACARDVDWSDFDNVIHRSLTTPLRCGAMTEVGKTGEVGFIFTRGCAWILLSV